ncbi:hypothetical protein [Gordonia paraffinivorans]|uniref:hypothetical protein n=1 Tax=Gordonia paraffinivorans TaxID=175628 RepID=UPI001E49B4A5|nr:hypothetical protein [Gordonia paraffinivorans]MCD2143961.1 hypothetical protein [Gordonia paraffinivorans]
MSLDIRLSRSEKAEVVARARSLGIKASAWGRAVMLDALDAGRGEVERLHRAAARRPDPERAELAAQLRGIGVALHQEQRRRNGGYRQLVAVYRALEKHDALDDELRAALLDAARSLGERQPALLSQAIEKVDAVRELLGDGTQL